MRFYKEDKPLLDDGGEIKINPQGYPDQTLEIYIVEKISDEVKIKRSGFLTEPWIRTITFPYRPPDKRKFYKIWLEKMPQEGCWNRESPQWEMAV